MMTSMEALLQVQQDTITALFNNGTTDITLKETYNTIPTDIDANLLVDLLVIPAVEIASGSTVEVIKDNTSLGTFTFSSSSKGFYLSELLGITKGTLLSQVSQVLEFKFSSAQLIKTQLVTALSADFVSIADVLTNGISSNMYLLHETVINYGDENSLIALREEINGSTTTVLGNGTNVITINNNYIAHANALSKTLVMDNILIFKDTQKIGTQIFIKKNGVHLKTVTLASSTKVVYLSDLLGSTREALYLKTNESYELSFIYDTYINSQLVTGELANFTYANLVSLNPNLYNLFELNNSKSFEGIALDTNDCNFTIIYDEFEKKIKSATLDITKQQNITIEYVTDNTVIPSVKYLKISNNDNVFNVNIDLILNIEGLSNYVSLLKDFGRGLYE